jgi:hypothetical protein
LTVDTGLPEMKGRKDFYMRIAGELRSEGLLITDLEAPVRYRTELMSRLTTGFGRQLVEFISPPV